MFMSKVSRKGQATIPKEIREYLRIREGDRVVFIQKNNEVMIRPVKETLLDIRGSVKVKEPQDFQKIRKVVKRRKYYRSSGKKALG